MERQYESKLTFTSVFNLTYVIVSPVLASEKICTYTDKSLYCVLTKEKIPSVLFTANILNRALLSEGRHLITLMFCKFL